MTVAKTKVLDRNRELNLREGEADLLLLLLRINYMEEYGRFAASGKLSLPPAGCSVPSS